FDFEMITAGLLDGTGLEYLAGSYHPFGNNGTMPFKGNINDPSNTALPDLPNRIDVLNLMTTVTDHIPVVADYVFVSGDGPFSSGQAFWGARGFDRNTVAALARMVGGLPTPVNPPGDGQPLPVQSLPVISHDGAMADGEAIARGKNGNGSPPEGIFQPATGEDKGFATLVGLDFFGGGALVTNPLMLFA